VRFLCVGDLHLRASPTKYRMEDVEAFYEVQRSKLHWIIDQALEYGCHAIIQAGDFFDSPNVPYSVLNMAMSELKRFQEHGPVLVVYGQHDLRYHSASHLYNTPLMSLKESGLVFLAGKKPYVLASSKSDEVVFIYGAGWGDPIPRPLDESKASGVLKRKTLNVLIVHRLISDQPLFPGHKYCSSVLFLRKAKGFDLIVSGDNHQFFIRRLRSENRVLVNCGSVLRLTVEQRDFQPKVVLVDVGEEGVKIEKILSIPIHKEVFDLQRLERERQIELNKALGEFISQLQNRMEVKLDFVSNLNQCLKRIKLDPIAKQVLCYLASRCEIDLEVCRDES